MAECHPPLASHESEASEGGGPIDQVSGPVCEKTQLVFVAGPIETWCYYCGAHWVQEGSEQQAIKPADPLTPALQPTWSAFKREHANV